MKVWQAFSAEHSASVKIIGVFSTVTDAEQAASLFNCLHDLDERFREEPPADRRSRMEGLCRSSDLGGFSIQDVEQLQFFEPIVPGGREIRVETESSEIQALLKVLMRFGAQIRVLPRQA